MSSSGLLGTPVRPRDQRSTGAPSPYTPNPFRSSSGARESAPSQPDFGTRTATESQTEAASSPRSSSMQPSRSQSSQPFNRQKQPTEAELKAQLRAAVAKTRIVADPSRTSAFKKEEDPELYALFMS
ncbi:hypothetical protein JCM11251_007163 [Rhodosporidiobolus azoricus]